VDIYRLSLANKALYSLLHDPLYRRLLKPGSSYHNGTYLHFAAYQNHLSLLQRLVERGGNLQTLNDISLSPLHYAVMRNHKDVCRWIAATDPAALEQRNDQGVTPLLMAAKARQWDLCRVLVQCGADVNAAGPRPHCWTCLHYAARGGQRGLVEFLLNHHADIKAVTGGGTLLPRAGWSDTDRVMSLVAAAPLYML
jgi:ankyrin repeat protein